MSSLLNHQFSVLNNFITNFHFLTLTIFAISNSSNNDWEKGIFLAYFLSFSDHSVWHKFVWILRITKCPRNLYECKQYNKFFYNHKAPLIAIIRSFFPSLFTRPKESTIQRIVWPDKSRSLYSRLQFSWTLSLWKCFVSSRKVYFRLLHFRWLVVYRSIFDNKILISL